MSTVSEQIVKVLRNKGCDYNKLSVNIENTLVKIYYYGHFIAYIKLNDFDFTNEQVMSSKPWIKYRNDVLDKIYIKNLSTFREKEILAVVSVNGNHSLLQKHIINLKAGTKKPQILLLINNESDKSLATALNIDYINKEEGLESVLSQMQFVKYIFFTFSNEFFDRFWIENNIKTLHESQLDILFPKTGYVVKRLSNDFYTVNNFMNCLFARKDALIKLKWNLGGLSHAEIIEYLDSNNIKYETSDQYIILVDPDRNHHAERYELTPLDELPKDIDKLIGKAGIRALDRQHVRSINQFKLPQQLQIDIESDSEDEPEQQIIMDRRQHHRMDIKKPVKKVSNQINFDNRDFGQKYDTLMRNFSSDDEEDETYKNMQIRFTGNRSRGLLKGTESKYAKKQAKYRNQEVEFDNRLIVTERVDGLFIKVKEARGTLYYSKILKENIEYIANIDLRHYEHGKAYVRFIEPPDNITIEKELGFNKMNQFILKPKEAMNIKMELYFTGGKEYLVRLMAINIRSNIIKRTRSKNSGKAVLLNLNEPAEKPILNENQIRFANNKRRIRTNTFKENKNYKSLIDKEKEATNRILNSPVYRSYSENKPYVQIKILLYTNQKEYLVHFRNNSLYQVTEYTNIFESTDTRDFLWLVDHEILILNDYDYVIIDTPLINDYVAEGNCDIGRIKEYIEDEMYMLKAIENSKKGLRDNYVREECIDRLNQYENVYYICRDKNDQVDKSIPIHQLDGTFFIDNNLNEDGIEYLLGKIQEKVFDASADYIIGYREDPLDDSRIENLKILLRWMIKYIKYTKNITIWIVEQDGIEKLLNYFNPDDYKPLIIRYVFLYNPTNYNRGWAFNCVIQNHCKNKTIVMGDTDVLFNEDFPLLINECNRNIYYFINPYKNIWYTSKNTRTTIKNTLVYKIPEGLDNSPVTFSGGLLIVNRNEFLDRAGFEEFNGYAFEDRALDITIDSTVPYDKIKTCHNIYVHLWHPKGSKANINVSIKEYFEALYAIKVVPANKNEYIHKKCIHQSIEYIKELTRIRKQRFINGNEEYYKRKIPPKLPPNTSLLWGPEPIYELDDAIKYGLFLKGKRVVVVGPAPSIVGSGQRNVIDGYDVVVRLNKAFPVPLDMAEDIGTKTDIVYNCMNEHPENGGVINLREASKQNVWISSPYPNVSPFDRDIKRFNTRNEKYNVPFHVMDASYYEFLSEKMESRPNTGTCCILDLLRYDIAELYITGITFFKGGYYSKYRNYDEKEVLDRMTKFGNHKQFKQFDYLQNILINDPRVKCDKALQEILEEGLTFDHQTE